MSILNIQPISEDSIIPTYSKEGSYTVYANADTELIAGQVGRIGTGFKMSFPPEYCALMLKNGSIKLLGCLIDSDFRGEITAICLSSQNCVVKRGDAIARMVLLEIALPVVKDDGAYVSTEECIAN